jgi:hypothetical protein
MAKYGIDITSLTATFNKVDGIIQKKFSQESLVQMMCDAAKIALYRASELCPVDTGKLKASLEVSGVRVTNEGIYTLYSFTISALWYAWYNEFGWHGIPPIPDPPEYANYKGGYRPFMRVGGYDALKYVESELYKELNR